MNKGAPRVRKVLDRIMMEMDTKWLSQAALHKSFRCSQYALGMPWEHGHMTRTERVSHNEW